MHYGGFKLDPFQEEACRAIEAGESVIVAAPTGAGKTVIAEYATEQCRKLNRRVIYTAPIKALSNQKFRDFRAKFGAEDVGIVTGDVVLNARAPILVMTTEIFRNTIFDDITQLIDVECVIFDEIHFINDIERGTVWEESIIFAPQGIKMVCLSATIPNLQQFAGWIQSVRDINLRVVSEAKRPVPLEHVIYMPGWGVGSLDDLKNTIDSLDRFGDDDDWDRRGRRRRRRFLPDHSDLAELVADLRQNHRLPCLYFCFSRRGCEDRARQFRAQGSFLSTQQSKAILESYDAICETFDLTDDPRAMDFRNLIEYGIAYHHAGMLPTLKEAVERLFTEGMIQLLFTTETFAVGINMPARSVVFESLEKYDGVSVRPLKAREYQQMSGRAGRRGIDERGYVYATVDPGSAQFPAVKHTLTGHPEAIESQFNLSYSSILNLLDEYGSMIFEVAEKSFSNYQSASRVRELNRRIRQAERRKEKLPDPQCHYGHNAMELITQYRNIHRSVEEQRKELRAKRRDIKRKFRGRKGKPQRDRALSQLNREEANVKREYGAVPCHGCKFLGACQKRYSEIGKAGERLTTLGAQVERVKRHQRDQIQSRLRVLERLGYVEGFEVLPRGRLAKQIYGYELQVTQLVMGGYFERLDPDWMNALAVAMGFEAKRDVWFRKPDNARLLAMLKAAAEEVERLRALEAECGVDTPMQPMEPKLTAAVIAWSRGCEFDELMDYTSCTEGDIIRVFRSGADLLRQMRRALSDHPTLPERLMDAILRLNRDIVDAEQQLRADFRSAKADD